MQRFVLLYGILTLLLPAPGASSQEYSFAYDTILKWEGERFNTLGPTGRRIFAERMETMPGLRGAFGYCHTTPGFQDPLILEFRGEEGDLALTLGEVTWRPSRLEVVWSGADLRIKENKFITDDDMMVDRVTLLNFSDRSLGVEIFLSSLIAPLLERSRSEQRRLDLSEAANILPSPGRRLFTAGPNPRRIWVEGEKSVYPTVGEGRNAASGSVCLGNGFGVRAGQSVFYDVVCPPMNRPCIFLRYARGKAGDGLFRVDLDGRKAAEIALAYTRGWGDRSEDWRLAKIPAPDLKPGHLLLRITSLREDGQINLDGFFLAEEDSLPPSLPEGGAFEYRVPEQIPLRPGVLEYDSIGFTIPDPGPDDRPTLAALQGGIEGDIAHAFPEGLSFRTPDVRPALAVLHLLVMCPAPRGRGNGTTPALFEFRFDDASSESVAWPSVSSRHTRRPQDRAEWHFLVLPGTKEPAMRLAYTPPPGRFIREVKVVKGEGPEVPVLLAGTLEILPKEGRLPVLLGKPDYHGLPLHFVLAGDGFSLAKTPGGERGLYRYIPLEPGAARTFNVLLANGRNRFMTALKALDAARDDSLLKKHLAAYRKWYDENAPRFHCSDPFMEKAWHYRWYLARQAMVRPDTPDFTLPVFYDGIHADAHTWVSPCASSHIISEVRWLRDRRFAQGQIRALLKQQYPNGLLPRVRTGAREGIFAHWIPAAAFGAFEVNGSEQYLKEILPLLKNNLDAVFEHLDMDRDLLPSLPFPDPKKPGENVWLERPDFASYVHASARALSQGLKRLGEEEEARRFETLAEGIGKAVLTKLWVPGDAFFHTLRGGKFTHAPKREITGFYPFFSRLVPDEPPYLETLNLLVGMFATDDVGQDVIPSPHAASVIAEVMANALRYYGPSKVTAEVFSRFLKGYTRLHFENNDPERPVLYEPIHGETGRDSGYPDLFQSTYNDLLIRFIGGLVPCAEGRIELWPLVEDLEYFRFRNIPYHGRLLDIAWDRPDGERVYTDLDEGYTLMKDGEVVFTVQELKRMILD